MKKKIPSMQRGYITLMSVIILGVIGVTISVSILLLGLGASRNGLVIQQSYEAKALADTCAEQALSLLQASLSYSGGGTTSLGAGTCDVVAVTGTGNTNRIVETRGNVGSVVRKVKVSVAQVRPQIMLVSWKEVPDF